ncbi:hypothetical protein ACFFJ4_11495 [Xanthomonas dyei]|uniref:Uncharacterized protein n=1 Tax=Xanthomonas dyei TaxID=743699 RepID=A0A2S7C1R6_9XANT|nr:hypothetical protein [Xanthomonas dyei]PPU55504.1 hypothetical protein XdyCFBP7245_12995 [Xanthomonas dyei]
MRHTRSLAVLFVLFVMVAWSGPTQAELPAPWAQAALLTKPSAVDPVLRMVFGPGELDRQRAAARVCDKDACNPLGPDASPAWL